MRILETRRVKRVALVSAHFPPSNLVGVHRARLWAQHLPEFGWLPTIVTSHWAHYQEPLDWRLLDLVPENVRVVHTKALGLRFAKLIGNMALRALWWTRKELVRLVEQDQVDFMHIIVPDHYSALLGPLLYRSHRLPFGIDYMDPWVHARPGEKRLLSKSWASCALSYYLEPWSVRWASLITGVSYASIEGVVTRNPIIENGLVTAEIPMASSRDDYRTLSEDYRPEVELFDPDDGLIHVVYMGTIPPGFDESLRCVLSALKDGLESKTIDEKVRVWLIGTGTDSHGSGRFRIRDAIKSVSLENVVKEYPSRIGYTDALWHMRSAAAIVILSSGEAHYTPSKVYQAVNSGKPVLALLPEESGAAAIVEASGRGVVVNHPGNPVTVTNAVRRALGEITSSGIAGFRAVDDAVEPHSARMSARHLAESLDRALQP